MKKAQEMVEAFHARFGFGIRVKNKDNRIATNTIYSIGYALLSEAMKVEDDATAYKKQDDHRLYRTHLLVEELGEALIALAEGDEVNFFDGLCDLAYVILGCGVTMDLPIAEGFAEVHRSNMSKPFPTKADPRMRDRGTTYQKPNLQAVLLRHRGYEQCGHCGRWLPSEERLPFYDMDICDPEDGPSHLICSECMGPGGKYNG